MIKSNILTVIMWIICLRGYSQTNPFDTTSISNNEFCIIKKYSSGNTWIYIKKSDKEVNDSLIVYKDYFDSENKQIKQSILVGSVSIDSVGSIIATGNYELFSYHKDIGNKIILSGKMLNSAYDGVMKGYNKSNKVIYEETYQFGELNGNYKYYYSNGKLREEGNYVNGNKIGFTIEYHQNEKIKAQGEYNGNCREIEVVYDFSSDVINEDNYPYLECEKKGYWCFYSEKGKLIKREKF